MRRCQVLILLSIELLCTQQQKTEICGRSHFLDNLIDKGKLLAVCFNTVSRLELNHQLQVPPPNV